MTDPRVMFVPMGVYNEVKAENERLRSLLAEARNDLAEEAIEKYGDTLQYPGELRRYERDMDIVHRIDAALRGEVEL